MTGYLFKKKSDALALLDLLKDKKRMPIPSVGTIQPREMTHGWIFLTPSGGIAARSGQAVTFVDCKARAVDADDDLVEVLDDDGASFAIEIGNVFGAAIAGDTIITAKEVFGRLIADAEDCFGTFTLP